MRRNDIFGALLVGALLFGQPVLAQSILTREPLRASDWLSGSVSPPPPVSAWRPGDPIPPDAEARRRAADGENEVAQSAAAAQIGVTRLGAANPDGTGIISARIAGLPDGLWTGADPDAVIARIAALRPSLPAMDELYRRLLTVQIAPPGEVADPDARFFLARVDALLDLGALGPAADLLRAAGQPDAARFRRLFDISLLLGDESEACRIMGDTPGIAPSFPARIFCLAQAGDWQAAALTLRGAHRLGLVDDAEAQLMEQFLDDSYVDSGETLPLPDRITPLSFRLFEAIGQPLPTGDLPMAFAWSDMRGTGGWKAQLDSAERLARAGSLQPARLREIYLLQNPAASGGVWDRAAAIRDLARALQAQDEPALATALPVAIQRMSGAGLTYSLSRIFAGPLHDATISGETALLAERLRLYAGQAPAAVVPPGNAVDLAITALARGETPEDLPQSLAVLFAPFTAPPTAIDGPAGMALLAAIADVDSGREGDIPRAARGIATLRALGLEADARRAAIQLALGPDLAGPGGRRGGN